MLFHVHAEDRPGLGTEMFDLAEEHWSYMDRFDARLVLRGPTLSDDGEEHTGSIHVVEAPDRAAAERFATEEPYWSAGLYAGVTAVRAVVLFDRGPESDPDAAEAPHTLITGEWAPRPHSGGGSDPLPPATGPGGRLLFAALLVDDGGSHTNGMIAAVRALPDEAVEIVRPFADRLAGAAVALAAQRWCRGGRN
ncbi:YciI family protein [Nocardiopsis sp. NPDC058631]|uniref:YciI family protein n=1 Tax=Nocardiopsis sp. NPDC058631 TaxID=3346566 RepID=UPI0036654F0E